MIEPNTDLNAAAGLQDSFGGPRRSILIALKQAGSLTAKDLAGLLRLSLNAIRHHLKELEAESVVRHEREARGVGAPVYSYRLTEQGESLFPARYEAALNEVLDHMVEEVGRKRTVESLNNHYQQLGRRLADELAGASAEHRVDRVVRVLQDEGYMTLWEGGRESGTLTAHNCAMRAVAQKFPELCEAEHHFLTEVLGAAVTRGDHMLEGCSACEYHIDFRTAATQRGPIEEHA